MALRQFNKADDNFKLAQTILTKNEDALNYTLLLYNRMGYNYALMRKLDLAKEYTELEIRLAKKLHGPQTIAVSKGYLKLGALYGENQQLNKALHYYKLYEDIYIHLGLENSGDLGLIYYNIGNIYIELNQQSRAITHLNKALSIFQNDPIKKYTFRLPQVYKSIGDAYKFLEKKEKALTYYNKAKSTFIKPIIHGFSTIDLEVAIAQCLDPIHNEEYIVKTIEEAIQFYTKNDILHNISTAYAYLANMYFKQKNYDKSIEYHSKNLKYAKSYSHIPTQIYSNIAIAHNYCFLKEFIKANQHFKNAAELLNYNAAETPDKFKGVTHLISLPFYITTRTEFFTNKYEETNAAEYLDSIHLNNKRYIDCLEYLDHQFSTTTDKTNRLNTYIKYYDKCIRFYIDYPINQESAFEIAEKTKSRQLIINSNSVNAKKFGSVPDSLIQKEKFFNQKIAKLEKLKFESRNDSLSIENADQLFELKRQKDELYEVFLAHYPNYHNLKYNNKVINVSTIKQRLREDETLIEYFIGDKNIYIFSISKNQYNIKRFIKPKELNQWVTQLRNSIYSYDDENEAKLYLKSAHQLYNMLIAPIKEELKHKLIIIPDGVLNYIPFETLLDKKVAEITNYKNLPYLIKKHQISYNYSATLYHQLLNQKNEIAPKDLIAICP